MKSIGFLIAAIVMVFALPVFSDNVISETKFTRHETIEMERDCLLEKGCIKKCHDLCKARVGEECVHIWDVCTTCLNEHPPSKYGKKFIGSIDSCDWCAQNFPDIFKRTRCSFKTGLSDQRMMGSPEPKTISCYITCPDE